MSLAKMKKSPRCLQTKPWLGDCQAALLAGLSSGIPPAGGVAFS